jgi:uncharacterized protein YjiS (DUF1127 family)
MEIAMNIFARFAQARRRRQAIRDLRALSPELLRDIGVEPGQIGAAASGLLAQHAPSPDKKPQRTHNPLLFETPLTGGDWPYPHQRA